MTAKTLTPRFLLALALVIFGTVLRIVPHPWNFAPVGAVALFVGAHFERRLFGILVPLAAMFAGDTALELFTGHGYHALMPVIYATYALIALLGMTLRGRRSSVPAVGAGVLASSVLFFVVTNFAVWLWSATYPKSIAGLAMCYVAGIPFFGNTLASDALFTAILFGALAAAERRFPSLAPAPSVAEGDGIAGAA